MRALVLDLTHGGDVLALEYLKRGWDTTAVDIYRNSSALYPRLEEQGVRCLQRSPAERFDLAVAPIHAPSSFLSPACADRVITHHQAVGELASFPFPTVEVTGVRGKTSTTQVLSLLLAKEGRKVLSLTSSGLLSLNAQCKVLEEKVSIAPATLLRISKQYTGHDIGVFEVSLGGSGLASVSMVTGLQDDYAIAAKTRRALDGKSRMISAARGCAVYPVAERAIWEPMVPEGARVLTFGPGGDVEAKVSPQGLGEKAVLSVRCAEGEEEVSLQGGYLSPAYSTAFAGALTALKALGMDPLKASRHLSSFPGASGRGEVIVDGRGALVRERNPGVSAASLEFQLGSLVNDYGCRDIGLVLDPVNRKVCEKLDLRRVAEVCDRFPQVSGRYMLPSGEGMEGGDFRRLPDVNEARSSHDTVLWATKEGYL